VDVDALVEKYAAKWQEKEIPDFFSEYIDQVDLWAYFVLNEKTKNWNLFWTEGKENKYSFNFFV